MNCRVINQYSGESPIVEIIRSNLLLQEKYKEFRCICAFVSFDGIFLIKEELNSFLERKNNVKWVFGLGGGLTSRETFEYLKSLKEKYSKEIEIKIIVGTGIFLIHPKIYWFKNNRQHVIIIGSSNFTSGGLLTNFETSLEIYLEESSQEDRKIISQFENLWNYYYKPHVPLTKENIKDISELDIDNIPKEETIYKKIYIKKKSENQFSDLNKTKEIFERIRNLNPEITKRIKPRKKRKTKEEKIPYNILIMDITQETRKTQIQIPKDVAKNFFDLQYPQKKRIDVVFEDKEKIKRHLDRKLFSLEKSGTIRMEIPEIKDKQRWLIIRFKRDKENPDRYYYRLYLRGSEEWKQWDTWLDNFGERKRLNTRRYYMFHS